MTGPLPARRVVRYALNERGRDLVVGDVHGSGVLGDDPAEGHLTMADVGCRTATFTRKPSGALVEVYHDEEAETSEFYSVSVRNRLLLTRGGSPLRSGL